MLADLVSKFLSVGQFCGLVETLLLFWLTNTPKCIMGAKRKKKGVGVEGGTFWAEFYVGIV